MVEDTDLWSCFCGFVRLGQRVQITVFFINPNVKTLIILSLYTCMILLIDSSWYVCWKYWKGKSFSLSSSSIFIHARRFFAISALWACFSEAFTAALWLASTCSLLHQGFGKPAGWILWPGKLESAWVGFCCAAELPFGASLMLAGPLSPQPVHTLFCFSLVPMASTLCDIYHWDKIFMGFGVCRISCHSEGSWFASAPSSLFDIDHRTQTIINVGG